MKRILVIEDNEMVLELICDILGQYGYEVLAASDGLAGLKMYQTEDPCLVITDLIMPNKDGLEVIMELKKQDPKTKVIAITGGGRLGVENYLLFAEQLGANYTLGKPFAAKELLEIVGELLAEEKMEGGGANSSTPRTGRCQ